LREVELAYIREILRRAQTKEEAADILGIGRKTLYRKEFEIQNYFSNESEPS
jgi:transcriptional regulator with PAS, ATPase and Fis domain